jgi:UDP-N-acetyl-D-glucosamine dehydrogenase
MPVTRDYPQGPAGNSLEADHGEGARDQGGGMNGERLAARIRNRVARLTVVGQGYVGLPLAVEFARAGFLVSGLDADADRVAALNLGWSPTPDVEAGVLAALLREGRYVATTDVAVLKRSDAVVICVPTPLSKSKDPDVSYVTAAAQQVAACFRPDQLVVLESTTYPGTTEELLLPMLEARGAQVGRNCFLAFSPERIDPGNRRFPLREIPKVVGGVTPACTRLTALLYRQIIERVIEVSSPKAAELTKLYENVFRSVNIALANEFALMCRPLGVDTREVIEAAATKPFGFQAFYPGPGIGGHCIPIDPSYLAWRMRLSGYDARFIRLADSINRSMPDYVVGLTADALNERHRCLNGARVLALGVAYKRGVGDIRESPALEVLARLRGRGAEVAYADPYVPTVVLDGAVLKAVEPTDGELAAADCVLVLTDHQEFDYQRLVEVAGLVLDTRGATWGIPAPAGRVIRL